MEGASFWGRLEGAVSLPDEGRLGLFAWLREKTDLARYRPEAASGVEVSRLSGREKGHYYVLKNPAAKTYYRMSDRDYYLWEQMDGSRSVKDLVVAYFMQYGSFAFSRVAGLVQGLKVGFMLSERPVHVYGQVRGQLAKRSPGYSLNRFWQTFLEKQFAISGLDGFLGSVYRWGARLLFTWPLQILYLVVIAIGLYAFVKALRAGDFGVVTIAGSLVLGVIGLIVANLISIFFHEMAHALTVKHCGREVRRGGFMIYFGMPAFFIDTTDIWMAPKRARLAVTWAGPHSGLILAGLASILILAWPGFALNALLFQFAFLTYLTVFLNLNPLLELDGYYLLMDGLEIPMLRRRSFEFLRTGLGEKLKGLRPEHSPPASGEAERPAESTIPGIHGRVRAMLSSFSREEKVFAVFGLLSAAWTAYAIYMGAYFWQQRLAGALRDLWTEGGGVGKFVLSLGMAALSLLFVLSIGMALLRMMRAAFGWAARRGAFASAWNVGGMLLGLAFVLAMAPRALESPLLAPLIGLAALVAASYFAWRTATDYAGSRLARVYSLLAVFALALLLGEVVRLAGSRGMLDMEIAVVMAYGLGLTASLALLLAGLSLFSGTNLRELSPTEMGLLGLGLVATCAVATWQAVFAPRSGSAPEALWTLSGSVASQLVLTLMVPTLFSFWRTSFWPAWLMLALSLAGLAAAVLLSLPPLLPYLLLAAALIMQHLAYRRMAILQDRPEANLDLSDRHRLQRAFAWTVSAILAQFRQAAGNRAAHIIEDRFNHYSLAAGWQVCTVQGQAADAFGDDLGLIELGELYAAALSLLLDQLAGDLGEKMTIRALQAAYDTLPWEEREIGAQYLYRHVNRASVLSREFQDTALDYWNLLRRMPLLATMDRAGLDLLASRLKVEQFSVGQAIIRQDDRGDKFYILRQGHVEVLQRDERGVTSVVNQLDRGDYFGELALLRAAPRNATCRATVPTQVLSLSRSDFAQLVRERFDLREKVGRSIAHASLLRRMPLFAEMDPRQIELISAQLRQEWYQPGDTLMRQGEMGATFCVIESGRLQVTVAQNGAEKVVAERGPGEYVGEIALLLEMPRTATVTALTRASVLILERHDFDRLVAEHLCVSRELERDTSRRLRDIQRAA